MNTGGYILKRVLSAIPLLISVSMISFGIIRLNLTVDSINISSFFLFLFSVLLFSLLNKIKNWFFFGLICLSFFIYISFCLSRLNLLPYDLLFSKKEILIALNFITIFSLFLIYWSQSFISKNYGLPKIVLFIIIIFISLQVSSIYPIKISVKPIILKSGDPLADLRFNPAISKETLLKEEKRLGLDKSWHIQYLFWVKGLLHGDLGITQQNQPVIKIITKPILNTLLLSLSTLFSTWLIAIPLGIWAALEKDKFLDKFFNFFTSSGMSIPSFVLAIIGLLFAIKTQIFPIGGLTSINYYELNGVEKFFDIIKHLLLPTCVLTIISLASLQRQMRANLLDVLRQEYIRTATAKGLPINKVIYKHAVRNAINPLITIFGLEFASLLSGAALTETILSYPGIGALTLEAARKLDVNLTMATLTIGACMLVLGNLISDLLLKFADPRIKLECS